MTSRSKETGTEGEEGSNGSQEQSTDSFRGLFLRLMVQKLAITSNNCILTTYEIFSYISNAP